MGEHFVLELLNENKNIDRGDMTCFFKLQKIFFNKKQNTYNVKMTEKIWLKKYRNIIQNNIDFLQKEENKERYEYLYHYLTDSKLEILINFLNNFLDNLNYGCRLQSSQFPLFWLPYSDLRKKYGYNDNTIRKAKEIFTILGLIFQVPDCNVNLQILDNAIKYQKEHYYKRHSTFYSVLKYNNSTFELMNKQAKKLKEVYNMTTKNICKNWVTLYFETDVACIVFQQDEPHKKTEAEIDYAVYNITKKILNEIENKGYCLEKKVKNNYKWGIYKKYILEKNGLLCIRASNVKDKLNLNCNGNTKIICRGMY